MLIFMLIVAHHYSIHPELQGVDRFFQLSDSLNPFSHEFWALASLLVKWPKI